MNGSFGGWEQTELGQVHDLAGIAVGATGSSLECGTDLRMLWEMLARRHEEGKG